MYSIFIIWTLMAFLCRAPPQKWEVPSPVCLWNTDTNKLSRHIKNGNLQIMQYKSLPMSFISMEVMTVPNTQRNRFYTAKPPDITAPFLINTFTIETNFVSLDIIPGKLHLSVYVICYLGSDQENHLDQNFVSNWPLASTEWRARV